MPTPVLDTEISPQPRAQRSIMERRFGRILVRIDPTLCVGFGDCITEAADVFELDDDGVVRFRDEASAVAGEALLLTACGACPVDALTAYDEDGRQLVP
jgi:ferredoxin